MACGAHRVLAVRRGSGAGTCLLGLSDDVDCAVVELSVSSRVSGSGDTASAAEQPATSAAPASQHPAAAAGDQTQQQSEQQGGQQHISATHVASIPALAYVAAGKTQRKALLLAPPGDALVALVSAAVPWLARCSCRAMAFMAGGRVAAALIEAQTFAYVYAATGRRDKTSGNTLLELHDPADGAGVLGAALLATAGRWQLLVLFANELKVFGLQH